MTPPPASAIRRNPVAIYFALVFILAWAVWIPLGLARRGPAGAGAPLTLTLLAGAAPCLAASIAAWAAFGREGVSYLWGRLTRWRIGPAWYLAALALPAALALLTAALVPLLTRRPQPLSAGAPLAGLLLGLLTYIPLAVFEEVGWRGLAQPGLQTRLPAAQAGAIVGIAWGLWHLPYFLIPDFSFFPEGSGFAAGFALYCLGTIPTCILIAWLFNNSGGSLLLPCIFHGATNVFSGAFVIPLVRSVGLGALAVSVGLSTAAALIVLAAFGGCHLRRAGAPADDPAFRLTAP